MVRTPPQMCQLFLLTTLFTNAIAGLYHTRSPEFIDRAPRRLRQHLMRSGSKLLQGPSGISDGSRRLRVSPAQFGGDPTGRKDSTAAVTSALQSCINASRATPGTFPDLARDARGCSVDLEGSEWMISTTLTIPTYVSNIEIGYGSLRANPTAWNHGDTSMKPSQGCGPAAFPVSRTGQLCVGLHAGPAPSHGSAEACLAACCAAGCSAYQYCSPIEPCAETLPAKSEGCWLSPAGYNADGHCTPARPGDPRSDGWVGASMKKPPPPPFNGSYMVVVGGTETCISPDQGSCNEDVGFPELFLDGSHVAAGIEINQVMGTTVGPQSYILNFTGYGIRVNGGHEVMVLETWLGQTNFDYNYSSPRAMPPSATAIEINSNDHYISDSIVFSSLVGFANHGAANMINGLHVWFPYNNARAFGATAFLDTGHQNRYTRHMPARL